MTQLDDLKARVETDWPDASLQALLDEANGTIEQRYGPAANSAQPLTMTVRGGRRLLRVIRRIDLAHRDLIVITERTYVNAQGLEWWPYGFEGYPYLWPGYAEDWQGFPDGITETATTLATDDWRALYSGRTLQRLPAGTHRRTRWAQTVDLTYVPIDDTKQRYEVAIKVAILALQYDGATDVQVGDVHITKGLRSASGGGSPLIYADERERLLRTLDSSPGSDLR